MPAIADLGIATAKIAAAAVTAAKIIYGKIRRRQGGSSTNWGTTGTTSYDYSETDTFTQVGSKSVPNTAGADTAVTFPVAFNQVPLVWVNVNTAAGANQIVQVNSVTTTGFNIRTFNNGSGNETCAWRAEGQ